MKLDAARIILGKPAFHVLATFLLAGAFIWPFLANSTPHRTWFFLHIVWGFAVFALFWIARGREADESEKSTSSDGAGEH